MSTPRIRPKNAPYGEEVDATFAKLMPPGMPPLKLFRTLAHNPRVLRRVQRGGLLDPGSISVRLRELTILRTCHRCGAAYEWGVHATLFAAAANLDDAMLAATCGPLTTQRGPWTEPEHAVLAMCDALHDSSMLDDDQWRALSRHFSDAQIVELVTLCGLYHAIGFIVNATGVRPEDWAAPMPSP